MKMKRMAGMGLIASMVVLLLVLGSVGAWAEEGVTDTEIRIGSTGDLSGPIAFMGVSVRDGLNLYFKYINDQGGIHGRKIKLLVEDDGFQSPRAVQGAKKLITRDGILFMTSNLGSAACNAMYPLLEQYKVPMIPAGTANEALAIPPRKYLFLIDTGYTIQGILGVQYIIESLGVKNMKPACIYQEDITGNQWLGGVKKGCERYGIKDILELPFKRGAVDFSAQIAKCKEAGVTHIFTHTNVREPAAMMKEAQRIQYRATYITDNASIGPKILELIGDTINSTNGYYGTGIINDVYTEDTKGYRLFKKLSKKYGMCSIDNTMHLWAFNTGMLVCDVLERAGKNLTRESLMKACEETQNYDNGIHCPITWSPDRRDGGRSVKIYKVVNGKWAPQTGWITIQ